MSINRTLTDSQLLSKYMKAAHPSSTKINKITNTEYYAGLRKQNNKK